MTPVAPQLSSPSSHREQTLRLRDALERLLTPSLVLAYWMRGSIAGLSYRVRQRFGLVGLGPKESIDLI